MTVLFDNTDLTVEMAFGDPPLDESPTWTDVTAYVRKVDINRGRPIHPAPPALNSTTVTDASTPNTPRRRM